MGVYTHIGLHDQSSAIESLPAPPGGTPSGHGKAKQPASANGKADGSQSPAPGDATGLGQLDAVWGTLPENIKAGILALVNAAVEPRKGSVVT